MCTHGKETKKVNKQKKQNGQKTMGKRFKVKKKKKQVLQQKVLNKETGVLVGNKKEDMKLIID